MEYEDEEESIGPEIVIDDLKEYQQATCNQEKYNSELGFVGCILIVVAGVLLICLFVGIYYQEKKRVSKKKSFVPKGSKKKFLMISNQKTFGELFTLQNDNDFIRNRKPQLVSFAVNKAVIIETYSDKDMLVRYQDKSCHIRVNHFTEWEITLARFLGVDDGSKEITLKDVTIKVNAFGEIYPSSLQRLEQRILQQWETELQPVCSKQIK